MAIEETTPVVEETPDKYKWALMHMMVEQEQVDMDDVDPIYELLLVFRRYWVDSTKKRHWTKTTRTISLVDYMKLAKQKASAGDTDLLAALMFIEKSAATILTDQAGIDVRVI